VMSLSGTKQYFFSNAHEFQRRPLVPPALDQNVEDLASGVYGSPQIDHAAINFQIESSGPGELHPQALTDPDVSVSTHPGVARYSSVQCAKRLAPDGWR
jgi:hypothetical protein